LSMSVLRTRLRCSALCVLLGEWEKGKVVGGIFRRAKVPTLVGPIRAPDQQIATPPEGVAPALPEIPAKRISTCPPLKNKRAYGRKRCLRPARTGIRSANQSNGKLGISRTTMDSLTVRIMPNPDEPEPNRCMMSSQKTEVGHTLKSKMR
jgi:hypothetical protein